MENATTQWIPTDKREKHWRATCSETGMRGSERGGWKRAIARWYLADRLLYYSLSYRDLEEMMQERGLHVDHTTIYVRRFGVCEISP
jgi:hypothetical protein